MTAYNERDEWRAACDDDWRSELPARPANDPTPPPQPYDFEEWEL